MNEDEKYLLPETQEALRLSRETRKDIEVRLAKIRKDISKWETKEN